MNMKTNLLYVVALASLALTGCSKDDGFNEGGGNNPSTRQPISFESGVMATTKAPITGVKLPTTSGVNEVGLFALKALGKPTVTTPTWATVCQLMYNVKGTTQNGVNLSYSPLSFYSGDSVYTFVSYYPYTVTGSTGDATYLAEAKDGVAPLLKNVVLKEKPADQIDYLWATPIEKVDSVPSVQSLMYNHAQTKLSFKLINGLTEDLTVVSFKVVTPKKGDLDISTGKWTIASAPALADSAQIAVYTPSTQTATGAGVSFEMPDQAMLYPVDKGAVSGPKFEIVVKEKGGSAVTKTGYLPLPSQGKGLEAGVSYLYTLNYGRIAIDFTASVVEWKDETGGSAPIL